MSDAIAVTARIDTVTVTEDRAHVRRAGSLDVSQGVTRAVIDDVAPVIADKTLRARANGAAVEARVVRRVVATEPAERHAALAREVDEKTREADLAQSNIKRLQASLDLHHEAQKRVLEEIAEDAARGTLADAATASRAAATFEERERTVYADIVAAQKAKNDLDRDLVRLRARLAQAGHRETRVVASIELTISADAAKKIELVVEYIVPGACFRPQHTATLDDTELAMSTDACVWQNTGEDWNDVALKLSTERPSLGQKPPHLFDDELATHKKSEVVRVEVRNEAIQNAGLGMGDGPRETTSRVPGIDDGGDVRVLVAKGRATIPSDGRPHRVPCVQSRAPSSASLVAYPELAEAVLVRAVQTNASKDPILAGPVDLVRASGFVGRTKIPLIAAGERFELGFGPDPHVRVRRELEVVDEDASLLSNWIGRSHRVRVHLSNLDTSPRKIEVTERVPVSEIEKVEVHFDEKKTSPRATPNEDGFVKWTVDLAARGRTTLELRYVIRRHKDVAGL